MSAAIEWHTRNAEFMALDRPDIYTVESALTDLHHACNYTKGHGPGAVLSFASYLVVYMGDEEHDDWIFATKLNSLYQDETDSATFDWQDLSNSMKFTPGVDNTYPEE